MTFLKENFEVIVVIFFILSIVLSVLILGLNKYFAMYFSNKKFEIKSSAEINAFDSTKEFAIQIFNKNINDIRVSGFGYVYKGQNIDFYQSYLKQKELPLEHKIVISSRDYLSAKIDMQLLKKIISNINKGSLKVDKVQVYVTDALGLTTTSVSKQVRKQINNLLLIDREALKANIKAQKNKVKDELKAYKQKKKSRKKY